MTERLAEAADVDETKVFDRIRSRFIQECAEHFDQGRGIAAVVEDPDNYFWHLMEMCVLARREGRPSPHPWFEAFCARLMDEDDGRREPPAEPTVN